MNNRKTTINVHDEYNVNDANAATATTSRIMTIRSTVLWLLEVYHSGLFKYPNRLTIEVNLQNCALFTHFPNTQRIGDLSRSGTFVFSKPLYRRFRLFKSSQLALNIRSQSRLIILKQQLQLHCRTLHFLHFVIDEIICSLLLEYKGQFYESRDLQPGIYRDTQVCLNILSAVSGQRKQESRATTGQYTSLRGLNMS